MSELAETLRRKSRLPAAAPFGADLREAAATIEAQAAEIERLRGHLTRIRDLGRGYVTGENMDAIEDEANAALADTAPDGNHDAG